ncbi:MAG: YdcH family protein [Pseudomonadota bacterium]
MNLSSHISQLRQRHETLDRQIEEATRQPGTDDLEITAMKRQKLHLKEEIVRLSATA